MCEKLLINSHEIMGGETGRVGRFRLVVFRVVKKFVDQRGPKFPVVKGIFSFSHVSTFITVIYRLALYYSDFIILIEFFCLTFNMCHRLCMADYEEVFRRIMVLS